LNLKVSNSTPSKFLKMKVILESPGKVLGYDFGGFGKFSLGSGRLLI